MLLRFPELYNHKIRNSTKKKLSFIFFYCGSETLCSAVCVQSWENAPGRVIVVHHQGENRELTEFSTFGVLWFYNLMNNFESVKLFKEYHFYVKGVK